MKQMVINSHTIGNVTPAYVIAEIGNNHCGDVRLAAEMIRVAHECGADAVKFQMRDNKSLYTEEMYNAPYKNRNSYGDTYGLHREALELSITDLLSLQEIACDIGIDFFATAFDIPSADKLIDMDVPAIKIASGGLTNTRLIEHCAIKSGKPIIISTGGATYEDIDRIYRTLRSYPIAFLHCLASYPNEPQEINLRVIQEMQDRYYDATIGFSCHYNGICMAEGAFMLGARIIEKHFTLNHTFKGTDHALSLEPQGLTSLCQNLSRMHQALGDGVKVKHDSEVNPIRKMAQSVYTSWGMIPHGTVLSADDIELRTPADGLPAWEYDNIIGKVLTRDIGAGELLKKGDYE